MLHIPSNYKLVKELLRFQKTENTFIQVFEIPNTSFRDKKDEMKKGFDDKIKNGQLPPLYYKKDFKLGAYDAMIFYGADNKPNLEQLLIAFGDSSFTVMAVGEIPSNDKAARAEVLNELLQITVDKSLKDDADELKSFDIDLSNTEFKYNNRMSQVFYYTVNGLGDPAQDPFADNIMVVTYPAIPKSEFKERSSEMVRRWKRAGITIDKTIENNIQINQLGAFEMTMDGAYQGRKNKIYALTTSTEKSGVMFVGITYSRPEELFPQIKCIARTLKIK